MRVKVDVAANVTALLDAVHRAADAGAEILLTPEGSLSGYTADFDHDTVVAALDRVTDAARRRGLGLALGTCFTEADGCCYNQVRFYGQDGTLLGFHAKTLTCGTLTDPPRGEVERYAVTPLTTRLFGDITTGGLICNDLWANPACTPGPVPI
jgi:predicted amidohydrolase